MRRHLACSFSLAAGLCAGVLFATPAAADEPTQVQQVDDDIQVGAATKKDVNILVVPIPMVNPALGNGVTLVTGVFYSPVQGGRQWLTGVGGMYTSESDWALGLAQQADLLDGKLRLTAFGGYGDFNLDFFGIGQGAGSDDRSVRLNEKGLVFSSSVLYDVAGPVFLGLKYRYLKLDSKLASPLFPKHPIIPNAQLDTTISGLGPSLEIDTRNSEFMPSKGLFVTGTWLFDTAAFGSDFSYGKLNVAANAYVPLTSKTVLALRASVCESGSGAPFYDLCFFGSNNDLRGYEGGRYRDHDMAAMQAELRQHLFWRLGAVAFVGVGGVAPNPSELWDATPLPSAGLGLRLQPTPKVPVNISIDYAWGKNSQGVYLYVGEAF